MASRSLSQDDSELIAELHSLHKKSPKLVKVVQCATAGVTLESWKMNESRYYDVPSPFPTLARGLFSIKEHGTKGDELRYRIVARGYDKFFNIGEVPWTTWSSLEAHTKPPYTLTLKSNGCIIFVAALSTSKLLVTSKHSLGPHAQAGERWLHRHLEQAGKTTEQLAETLWTKNWTIAAELCDDSFEEHVLPYTAEKTGLHLHGINDCARDFRTQPAAMLAAFAREWGFIATPSVELQSVQDVKAFTDEIGRNGTWNGEALEGFVVRTTVVRPSSGNSATDKPPYAAGSSCFFKVKFDEPYIMYRDWREITKALLERGGGANLPKSKMARPETKAYVKWVRNEIKKHPALFDGYAKGHGVIATRERFLRWLETAEEVAAAPRKQFGKTIIMPIAVPGVGKTTISVALAELFQFGHTQSDNFPANKRAFIESVKILLRSHDVVIADKNNHLRMHRRELRDAVKRTRPPVRLLAFNWSLDDDDDDDQPHAEIHRICADRIMKRGTNHQTLRVDNEQGKAHEGVLWQFLRTAEPLGGGEADTVVEMDVREDLEHALERAVDAVVRVLGLPRPDAESVGAALSRARGYRPLRADVQQQQQPRYVDRGFQESRNGRR